MPASLPTPAALVTGASRGIGAAIARQLAARGVRVAVHFRENRAAAEATLAALTGPGHVLVQADLAKADDVARLWREATAALGRVSIVINNAGIYHYHPPLLTDYAAWGREWARTLDTNLMGPANLSLLAAQAMASAQGPFDPVQGRGRIVNISSRGAFRGEPLAPAYGASKAGLNALSQSLAKALAPEGIYVYVLAPGWVETDMAAEYLTGPRRDEILAQHPLGRVANPDEIARAAVFCALEAPAAMTGAILDLNGASYLRT
jgi:3-oxoacyl-[acyl-carrier protein] reductase